MRTKIYSPTYPADWDETTRMMAEAALTKAERKQLLQCLETPPDFWRAVNSIFEFQVDVCASADNAKCKSFITAEMDALAEWRPWVLGGIAGAIEAHEHNGEYQHVRCWCNPGFSKVEAWHRKAFVQAQNHPGAVVVVIGLPGGSQDWYHFAQLACSEIIELADRVEYLCPWPLPQITNNRESVLYVYRRKVIPLSPPLRTFWDWKKHLRDLDEDTV